ncbi:MAG: tRNA 4-thiouridine(8) synthase ThiI [Candidatus Omnitrophica bacterium]|nr:tRNA 4-thiouridine(8) synthase ThiI [Candidatus Omnitrophota bacterium]
MKAIALISGGLDSILSAKLIKEQGVEIIPVIFKIPFCHLQKAPSNGVKDISSLIFECLGVKLKSFDISEDFLKLLKDPRYGFGSNMNPCIDCKILMLKTAKELMKELGAEFLITGEVLAQRPMSQHRQALELIPRKAGVHDLVLRPLSAKNFPPTIPELKGWVNREKLLKFSGRGRRPQLELADTLGISGFSWPGGGCLLTDPHFSLRLKELINHSELTVVNAALLKFGRHFRISEKTKLVVGRDEKENLELEKLVESNDYLFYPNESLAGPTSLARGLLNEELIKLSCQITCYHCDLAGNAQAEILYRKGAKGEIKSLVVERISKDKLEALRI